MNPHRFETLCFELAVAGAPADLRARVHTAVRVETRLAQRAVALANLYGSAFSGPATWQGKSRQMARPLFEVARDNAREGCVRETYDALVAHHRATHAEDLEVRAWMEEIAFVETEHAALSWDIAAYLEARLTLTERRMLDEERRAAFSLLLLEATAPTDPRVLRATGTPEPQRARELLSGLESALLAA